MKKTRVVLFSAAVAVAGILTTACQPVAEAIPTGDWQKQETAISKDLHARRPTNLDSDPVVALLARQEAKLWATTLAKDTPKVEQARLNTFRSAFGASNLKANIVRVPSSGTPSKVHATEISKAGTFRTNALWTGGRRYGIGVWPHNNGGWVLVEFYVDGGTTASNRKFGPFRTADGFLAQNLQDFHVGQNNDWSRVRAVPGALKTKGNRDWGNISGSISGATGRGNNDGMAFAIWSDMLLEGVSASQSGFGATCTIPVMKLHVGMLDRGNTAANVNGLISRCRNGESLTAIANTLSANGTFTAKYGSLTTAAYVAKIHQDFLGREIPAASATSWVNKINAKTETRGSFALALTRNVDFGKRYNGKVLRATLSAIMLNRAPTVTEMTQAQASSFGTSGNFDLASFGTARLLIDQVINHADYRARVSGLGLGW